MSPNPRKLRKTPLVGRERPLMRLGVKSTSGKYVRICDIFLRPINVRNQKPTFTTPAS